MSTISGPVVAAMVIVGLALLVMGSVGMRESAATLKEGGAGIVAFEVARTPERAAHILRRWGVRGRQAAVDNLFADMPFLLGYGLLLAGLSWWSADRMGSRTSADAGTVCHVMAAVAMCAALLDMVEDTLLLRILRRSPRAVEPWASTGAWLCASLKFLGIVVVIGWLVFFVVPVLVVAG